MNRVPGVHINVTAGEGHMTAIRQPITTSPVYLFLEDGIPVRSTGFFNHNALYEVNPPQAGAVEILKGPGTALYGSDAIGGVINVMTRPAPAKAELESNIELGTNGWKRALISGGNSWGDDGIRADYETNPTINYTPIGFRQVEAWRHCSRPLKLKNSIPLALNACHKSA